MQALKKRHNEHSQLRPEEFEALEDEEPEEVEPFRKASASELANRRILKVKRPNASASTTASSSAAPDASAPKSNPFASVSFATTSVASEPAPFKNPFAGFGGLTSTSMTASKPPAPAPAPAPTASTSFGNFSVPSTSAVSTSSAPPLTIAKPAASSSQPSINNGTETEYHKKVRALNKEFLDWTEKLSNDSPISIWTDSVKDYIRYQKELREKYPDDAKISSIAAVTSSKKEESVVKADQKPVIATAAPFGVSKTAEPKPTTFSFTGSSSTDTAKPAAPTASFSFGSSSSVSNEKAAPVSASSAFSFGTSSSTSSIPAPVTKTPLAPLPSFPTAASTSSAEEKPSSSFSFGTSAPKAPTTASSFSFGGSSSSAAPSGLPTFSFGAPSSGAPAASTFSFGSTASFSFPTSSAGVTSFGSSSATASNANNNDGEEGGDDDEGEPILEPEKILRNENDTDEFLLDVPCKLSYFNKEEKEWKDKGKGNFRLTKDVKTGKKRMLVRNTMGKVTFNAAPYKGMKFEHSKDKLIFNAFVSPDDKSPPELMRFLLKLKAEDCTNVKSKLEATVAELK